MTRFRYKGTIPQVVASAHLSVSLFSKVFLGFFWTCVAVYLSVAATLLGLRYWVLPNVDQWRPEVESYASKALGVRVEVGQLKADWKGLNPSFDLTSLVVYGENDQEVLNLPSVSAVLAWRSVLFMSPRFLSLRIDEPDIVVRRDVSDRLWVAGQRIPTDGLNDTDKDQGQSPLLRWLAEQRDLAVVGAIVHWQDESRQAPDIALRNVNLRVYNGLLNHRFSLSADPPAALAQGLVIRGSFHRNLLKLGSSQWDGELYGEIQDADPQVWQPWVSLPDVSGRAAARVWLTWDNGSLTDLTADAAVRDVRWQQSASSSVVTPAKGSEHAGTALSMASGVIHVSGAPGDIAQWDELSLARSKDSAGMGVQATLTGLQANLPGLFEPTQLQFDTIRLDGSAHHLSGQPLTMDVRQFDVVNEDAEINLHGRWLGQGKTIAGTADFQGNLVRGRMSAIHKYLPLEVDADAREWLSYGLPAGQISNAAVIVQGDLDEFPFEDETDHGQFRIAGAYSQAIVNYAPADKDDKGWPKLENLSGNFAVDKVSLSLDSMGGGIAHTGKGQTLKLGKVKASIPNMEHAATLHLDGLISGPVPAFLALSNNYQLGELLDGLLDEAQGTGQWQVPLKLEVPLLDPEDAKVSGKVVFAGNSFRFVPEMPMLSNVQGELMFSEQGARIEKLQALFLGGPVRVDGRLEQPRDMLNVSGTVTSKAVTQWVGSPALDRLSGQVPYRGRIGTGSGGELELVVESDLKGLASDLPAPLKKSRDDSMLMKAQWGATDAASSGQRDQLSVTLGSDVSVLLEHDRRVRGSYFSRGALSVNRPVSLPATPGLVFDAQLPSLDLDAWQQVAKEAEPTKATSKAAVKPATSTPLLPAVNQINLRTDQLRLGGWRMDDLTLSAFRPKPSNWQVDLESGQAGGTISWQEASGAIAGRVIARLTHLDLGSESDVATSLPVKDGPTPEEDLSDIPAIDLHAEKFSVYGRNVGKLNVSGTNLKRGETWRLDKLHISNEAAALDATGTWQLKGSKRGLTVDAEANFSDLGAFIDRIGYPGKLSGGAGTVKGTLTWRDLPWTHDLNNIEAQAQSSLDKGRFLTIDSRGARLLELLSLQSLQRIALLEANPAQAVRDGFPFDTIRGDLSLNNGIAHTEGYKLNGPVATIVLAGDTDIVSEQWNMKAVVIPHIDASGAAVVTALAVNPIIGLGAFLTQWLLKQPLARAMTMEYGVKGSWDEPKIEAID